MDSKAFHLQIITPDRVFFDGPVLSLIAPGADGSLGVLVNHAPLITTLVPGRLVISPLKGEKQTYSIGAGFMDVLNNQVILLTESIKNASATILS